MDAELVALANTAGTTLVAALATDAWDRAKAAAGALWRRVHPDRADTVEAELVETRGEVLTARANGDDEAERALAGEWEGRLRRLLAADPAVAGDLRRLVDDLRSVLPAGAQVWHGDVRMNATASGHARINQVGQGTQHIIER